MLTIFFDLDGVLIDGFHSDPARRVRWDTTLKEDLGIDPDDLVSVFFQGSFLDVIVGKRDCLESLNEILPDISDGSVSAETEGWDGVVFQDVHDLAQHPDILPLMMSPCLGEMTET